MKNTPGIKKNSYAAFLRGINVGGKTLIKMEDLREAFEVLGFLNVKTVLASGNVLFDSPLMESTKSLSQNIGVKLRETLGREILVIVRSTDDLRELEARQPFRDIEVTPGARMFVTFLPENSGGRDISCAAMHKGFQILSASDGVVCSVLHEEPGIGAAELMAAIEKVYGPKVTTRSWNTIARMLKNGNKG